MVEDNVSLSRSGTVSSSFRAMLNYAVKHDDIYKNPAKSVDIPKQPDREHVDLSNDEVLTLLVNCSLRDRIVFSLAAYAGLRVGEVLGLDWQYVNLHEKKIYVCQQLTKDVNGWEINLLKTPNAKRNIPINENFVKELKEWKLQCGSFEYLFPVNYGGTIHRISGGSYQANYVNKVCQRVGIRQASMHDLRHWFGAFLLTHGVPLFTVSRLMGHASIKITADKYGYLIQGTDREAVKAFLSLSVEVEEYDASNFYNIKR